MREIQLDVRVWGRSARCYFFICLARAMMAPVALGGSWAACFASGAMWRALAMMAPVALGGSEAVASHSCCGAAWRAVVVP